MKNIIAAFFALVSVLAFAAEPTIRVNDLGNVYQVQPDGTEINLGAPYDAIANNPALAAKIQVAAQVRLAAFKAEQTVVLNAAVAAKEQEKQAALNAATAARDAALAAKEQEKQQAAAAAAAQLATAQARIAQLEAALRSANVAVPPPPSTP